MYLNVYLLLCKLQSPIFPNKTLSERFFLKVNPDKFHSQMFFSDSTPTSNGNKRKVKRNQQGKKRKNLRDFHSCCKVKDIAKGKRRKID